MRILIVKTSSLGDVVHMLPAITDAVRIFSDLVVDWVVEESFQSVPAWHSSVNKVIPVAIRRWRKNLFSSNTRSEIAMAKNDIQAVNYDLIIDAQGLIKSSILTRLSKGKRAGYNFRSAREPLASWAYDQQISVSKDLHAIERNRQLTALSFGYSLEYLPLDYGLENLINEFSSRSKIDIDLPENYIVGLHGTSRPDKEWPEENWIQLSQKLADQKATLVLPWGDQREHDRAERIREKGNAFVLPKLDLDCLAEIICRAKAVVGMDTGLMHIAAALGKSGVAIYPVTKPELTGVISGTGHQSIINLEGLVSVDTVFDRLDFSN
ncbi:MAG: lipopolysaccharide heptosyltransferase I [Gammaproteobacteria bacterium]